MPNRIIKETICTSEEIDSLTDAEEVFFYRLMVNCDDFGLFDGRVKIIASKCYPLKSIDINCIQLMLDALVRVGLISMYEFEGRPYLALTNWAKHQQIRAKRAKYPTPDQGHEIICNQLISDAPVIQSNPIQSKSNKPTRQARFDFLGSIISYGVDESVARDYISVRKAKKCVQTETAFKSLANEVEKSGLSFSEAISLCCKKGWGGFEASWIKPDDRPAASPKPFDNKAWLREIMS